MVMAAEVGSVVRLLRGEKEKGEGAEGRGLVTRDLLGGCDDRIETKELDLDLEVPLGWEKRLDLASGEVYFHQSSTAAARPPPPPHLRQQNLNFPPLSAYTPPNLDLKLSPSLYQSVCTLDDVRSALHRLESAAASKPKTPPASSPSSSASSSSSSSGELEEGGGGAMVATGCASCLSYVLVPEGRRRCPRCRASVEVSVGKKRRRSTGVDLDLNLGRAGAGEGGICGEMPVFFDDGLENVICDIKKG